MSKDGKIKGYVYKIYHPEEPDMIYIGSTASSLIDRLNRHRGDYRRWKKDNNKNYVASYKIFEKHGPEKVIIEKLEKLYFLEKAELLRLEGKWQRRLKCVNIVTNNDTEKINYYYYRPPRKTNYDSDSDEEMKKLRENPFKKFMYIPPPK